MTLWARDAPGTWIGFVALHFQGFRSTHWAETRSFAGGLGAV